MNAHDLFKAVEKETQEDFLTSDDDKLINVLAVCRKFMQFHGYRIADPLVNVTGKESKFKDLLDLFRANVALHYGPDAVNYHDDTMDIVAVKNFVKARQKATGSGPKVAKRECALLIDTIFSNLEVFSFHTVPRPSILHNKKFAWVLDKALDILASQEAKANAKAYEELLDASNDADDGIGFSIDDL